MASLLHKGHGKFYSSVVIKTWKRYNFHDNFVGYHAKQDDFVEEGDVIDSQEHKFIHPMRDAVREFLQTNLICFEMRIKI